MVKILFFVSALCLMILIGCEKNGNKKSETSGELKSEITIYAAASLIDSVKEIAYDFEQRYPDIKTNINVNSSGQLAKQIANGAPADFYMSANVSWMDFLQKKGLILANSRFEPLSNHLVIISNKSSDIKIDSLQDLNCDMVKHIAIADYKSVPAGQYAQFVLKKSGVWPYILAKLIVGSDVRVTMAYVERGEVDCGIVYFSDAKISKKIKILFYLPQTLQPEIKYSFSIVKRGVEPSATLLFSNYLHSNNAREVFEKYGFVWMD